MGPGGRHAAVRLKGKVALVTGALGEIGAAITRRFLAEGAAVGVADVNPDRGARFAADLARGGAAAQYLDLDVTDEGAWNAAVAALVRRHGALHVLVNNAGIYRRARLEEIGSADWDRMLAVNARGVFLGCKAVAGAMRAAGGGSIVNLSSVAGLIGSAWSTDYNASKGAVRILTKCVAVQLAGDNIRCNSVHPAPIESPMGDAAAPPGEARRRRIEEIPLGRFGTADEVANAVLFLASDESSYVTGSELVVDGGLTAR